MGEQHMTDMTITEDLRYLISVLSECEDCIEAAKIIKASDRELSWRQQRTLEQSQRYTEAILKVRPKLDEIVETIHKAVYERAEDD